jgi:hypothetical protein
MSSYYSDDNIDLDLMEINELNAAVDKLQDSQKRFEYQVQLNLCIISLSKHVTLAFENGTYIVQSYIPTNFEQLLETR